MKKLLIASLFIAASCTHENQNVAFNLRFNHEKSNVGNNAGIDVTVIDDRLNQNIIGSKQFSADEKVQIISEDNIAALIKAQINAFLEAKGFKRGNAKLVEVHIEKLQYSAKRGFPVGNSEGEASLKVVVTNTKTKTIFTKNFNLSLNNKHFIAPLESTDSATINSLLQDIISDVVNNNELIKNLTS